MKNSCLKYEDDILEKVLLLSNIIYKNDSEKIIKTRKLQEIMVNYGIENSIIDKNSNLISKIEGKNNKQAYVIMTKIYNHMGEKNSNLTLKEFMGKDIYAQGVLPYSLALIGKFFNGLELKKNLYLIGIQDSKKSDENIKDIYEKFDEEILGVINIQNTNLGLVNNFSSGVSTYRFSFFEDKNLYNSNNITFAMAKFLTSIQDEEFNDDIRYEIKNISYNKKTDDIGKIYISIYYMKEDEINSTISIIESVAKGIANIRNLHIDVEKIKSYEGITINKNDLARTYINTATNLHTKTFSKSIYSDIYYPLKKDIDSVTIGIADIRNIKKNGNQLVDISSYYGGIDILVETLEKLLL